MELVIKNDVGRGPDRHGHLLGRFMLVPLVAHFTSRRRLCFLPPPGVFDVMARFALRVAGKILI
jgi:hypothetical protein